MATTAKVGKYMNAQVTVISAGATLNEAIQVLADSQSSGAAVFGNQQDKQQDKQRGKEQALVGMVSEQDCLKQLLSDSYHCGTPTLVEAVMSRSVETVNPNDSILDIADRMSNDPKLFPVVVDNALVGVIGHREVLQALSQNQCGNW